MFSGIGHVMVRVSSFEKALAFYRDTLGLKEAFRLYNDAGELWIIYLHVAGASFIELSESPPGTNGPSSQGFA
ncbi:MAG TPA: VOC family protein, partial [Limnochordia bacterium]